MGVGAAFIMPATLSILVNVFPPHERAKAIAIWATTTGIAGSIGPVITGWVLGHFWFGSAFLVYLPGDRAGVRRRLVLRAEVARSRRERDRPARRAALDRRRRRARVRVHRGARQGLGRAGHASPRSRSPSSCSRSSCSGSSTPKSPMLDMHYFRNPAFSVGSGAMMLVFLAMYGVMLLMTQYFQLVLGFSPLDTAIRLLPDRADHADRHAVHAAHRATLRRQPLGRVRHVPGRARLRALHPASAIDTPFWYCWLCAGPAHDRRVAVDGADDRVDHVGGAREPRRCRLGDERRHARARRRARHRGARQHRRVAVLEPAPRRARARSRRRRAARGRARRSAGALQVRPSSSPARRRWRSPPSPRPRSSTASTSRRCSASCWRSSPRSSPASSSPARSRTSGRCTPGVEALENAAEFGIGGAMPVFPRRADGLRSVDGPARTLLAVTTDEPPPTPTLRILVSFDIDGTMEFGDPPGPGAGRGGAGARRPRLHRRASPPTGRARASSRSGHATAWSPSSSAASTTSTR